MKHEEISELAKTTCSWLAYKGLTGFEELFIEAMLSLPIAEFLSSRKDWVLEQEVDYRDFLGSGAMPRIWCDFAGRRRYGKQIDFLLETKVLKREARKAARDIAADLVRLSLPMEKQLTRIFLLAGNSDHFPKSDETFLFSRMFGLEKQKGCNLKPMDTMSIPGFKNKFPHVAEAIEMGFAPSAIYALCRAIEEFPGPKNTKYKVVVWTVARTK